MIVKLLIEQQLTQQNSVSNRKKWDSNELN